MSSQVMIPPQRAAMNRYDQPDMVATIKQTVCKGASDAQLSMFLEVCKRTGLDPFLKEIYFVADRGIIMAGRDGYLRVANEDPQFDGMETRVERDEKNIPIKAICTVWRKDRTHPVVCEAYYSEYKKSGPVWSQYPSAMISKVAEVLALKRSFAINGVVTEEEIGKDGGGSAAAAQDVAQAKIAALQAGKTYEAPPIDAEFEDLPPETGAGADSPPPDPTPAEEAVHAVEDADARATKRPKPTRFAILESFRELKKRYQKIENEPAYYAVLKQFGVEKSSLFPETEAGLTKARACYSVMRIDVANLETQQEAAKGEL